MDQRIKAWHRLQSIIDSVTDFVARRIHNRCGLGLSEYRALQFLSNAEKGELRIQELASLLDLNQSSVSRLVERLERSGYTRRDICPDDKRGIYSIPTDAGKNKYVEAKLEYETALLEVLNQMQSEDPVNRKLIESILSIVD